MSFNQILLAGIQHMLQQTGLYIYIYNKLYDKQMVYKLIYNYFFCVSYN